MQEKASMPGEQTPLIQTVRIAPAQQRYPHQTLRRVCTTFLSGACLGLVLLFLIPFGADKISRGRQHDHNDERESSFWRPSYPAALFSRQGPSYSDLQHIIQTTPDEKKAEQWSDYYTAGPHLAGKNLSQAIWTQQLWQEFGVADSSIVAYDVYVNYPKDHRLALLETDGKNKTKVKFEARLEEDVLDKDSTSGLPDRVPTFHGYSASGNVTAQYVYVNRGVYQDFEDLLARNVSLHGKIGIARYGSVFRGLKVKRAQELGMIGMLIYSDPGDDGEMTEENGHKAYPDGPARQPSSVQRGSVQFLSNAQTSLNTTQTTNKLKASPQATPPHLATLRCQARHVSPPTTRSHTFPPYPFPTKTPFHSCEHSTATDQTPPRSTSTGRVEALPTTVSNTTSAPRPPT